MNISLIDIEEALPGTIIENDYFGEEELRSRNKMFSGTKHRRHIGPRDQASDYFSRAAKILIERLNLNVQEDIEMILTNVSLPDEPFTGCGAVVNKKIGAQAARIVDLHNSGCVSFLYLLDMANTHMVAHGVKHALICVGQSAAGRVFGSADTRLLAQAAIPGDGFAVAYVTNSQDRPVLGIDLKNYPAHSEDMYADCGENKWWEARSVTGRIDFNEDRAALITARGNKAVPAMIHLTCDRLKMKTSEIDYLITNQPNRTFLRNWREACQLPVEKHLDTFEKYANLFGAGIPITLAESLKGGVIKKGDLVCLAGFSHACDYSAAALIRW